MLWIKAFHIVFVVTWFVGLFYLPRLFIYHVDATDSVSDERFKVMERRLLGITNIGGALALLFGFWLLVDYAWLAYAHMAWLKLKLLLVVGLMGFHAHCAILVRRFRDGQNTFSTKFLRFYNEVPALFLIAIVILAVVKPF